MSGFRAAIPHFRRRDMRLPVSLRAPAEAFSGAWERRFPAVGLKVSATSKSSESRRHPVIRSWNSRRLAVVVFESWRFSVEKHHKFAQTHYADRAEPIVP